MSHMKAKKAESRKTCNVKTQFRSHEFIISEYKRISHYLICILFYQNKQGANRLSVFIMKGKVVYDVDILSQGLE